MQQVLTFNKEKGNNKMTVEILLTIPVIPSELRSKELSNERRINPNLDQIKRNLLNVLSDIGVKEKDICLIQNNGKLSIIITGLDLLQFRRICEIKDNIQYLDAFVVHINQTKINLSTSVIIPYYIASQRNGESQVFRLLVLEKITEYNFKLRVVEIDSLFEIKEIIGISKLDELKRMLTPTNIVHPENRYFLVFKTGVGVVNEEIKIEIPGKHALLSILNIFNDLLKIPDLGPEELCLMIVRAKGGKDYHLEIYTNSSILGQIEEQLRLKEQLNSNNNNNGRSRTQKTTSINLFYNSL